MTLFQLLPTILTIVWSRSGSFTISSLGRKYTVTITDTGANAPVTRFTFAAAVQIAGAIYAGGQGTFSLRVGRDVYSISLTPQ
jgi:hypothetical protein